MDFVPQNRTQLYIGGQWVAPSSDATSDVENPTTEQVIATVPAGTAEDVDRAVAAARAAFGPWSALAPAERSAHLKRLHEALTKRAEEIAVTVALELGTPMGVSTRVQAGLPLVVLGSAVQYAEHWPADETVGNSIVVREPVGVVGAITPWNYPLHQVVAKVALALAAGCTVVLKPADMTPLVAFVLFDAIDEAQLPPGVANLVTGRGSVVGSAISPVIKICANPETYRRMADDMDIDAGRIMDGGASLDEVGREIRDVVVGLADGGRTKSEELGHQEFILTYKSFAPIGPACLPAA
jgi:aldehyde dehydrogenase (NAD+)